MSDTTAYSERTNTHYPNWDELVAAEANGYVVVAIISSEKESWPSVIGPFPSKREANNARVRLRNRLKSKAADHPDASFACFVRPAWKDGSEDE